MSLNIEGFRKNYPFVRKVEGIDFEPLQSGSVIPRPYFTEKGAPILVTLTKDEVLITPNDTLGAIKLHAKMVSPTRLELEYRTRRYEGATPSPDLYARCYVLSVIDFFNDNEHEVNSIYQEYNMNTTNYLGYVGAMENLGTDPINALAYTWGGKVMNIAGFTQVKLLSPINAWMNGDKIRVVYSK